MAERDESDESKPEPAGGDVAADATGQAREQAGEEAAAREAAAREEIAPHQATDGETPLRPEVDDEPIREPEEATADADPPADAEPPTDANPPADGGPRGDVDLPPPPAAAPAPAPAPEEHTEAGSVRRGGSTFALLALALSVVALAFVSYPYWPIQPFPLEAESNARLLERAADERDRLALRIETLEASSRALAEELGVARTALETFDAMALERRAAMVELESKFNESFASAINAAPPSAREWRLAEAGYLLRVAGHRAVMERDFDGAIRLMAAADEVLLELDEPQLAEVRQLLAVELLNLKAVESTDVNGIFLRIEALKPLIGSLPLRLPVYSGASEEAGESTPPAGVIDRLFSLIEFRRHDLGATKPLLAPAQAEYVEQSLLAAFDRAQLSALRRDPTLFQASLASAGDLLGAYLDSDNANVMLMRGELEALALMDLSLDVPTVGDALVRLRELREMTVPDDSRSIDGEASPADPAPIDRDDLSAENVS